MDKIFVYLPVLNNVQGSPVLLSLPLVFAHSVLVGGDNSGWLGGWADGTIVYNNTFVGFPESPTTGEHILLNGASTVARNNLAYDVNGTFSDNGDTSSDNIEAGSNPFTDYAGDDWTLSGATAVGTTLSSPYDVDRKGTTRGADGNWDLGAYEFVSGSVIGTSISAGVFTVGP